MQDAKESEASQVELFLNSVPLLASLSREEKLVLVDALEEQAFAPGTRVVQQVPPPALASLSSSHLQCVRSVPSSDQTTILKSSFHL